MKVADEVSSQLRALFYNLRKKFRFLCHESNFAHIFAVDVDVDVDKL